MKKGTEREITNRRENVRIVKTKKKKGRNREDMERNEGKWEPLTAPQFPLRGVSGEWS